MEAMQEFVEALVSLVKAKQLTGMRIDTDGNYLLHLDLRIDHRHGSVCLSGDGAYWNEPGIHLRDALRAFHFGKKEEPVPAGAASLGPSPTVKI